MLLAPRLPNRETSNGVSAGLRPLLASLGISLLLHLLVIWDESPMHDANGGAGAGLPIRARLTPRVGAGEPAPSPTQDEHLMVEDAPGRAADRPAARSAGAVKRPERGVSDAPRFARSEPGDPSQAIHADVTDESTLDAQGLRALRLAVALALRCPPEGEADAAGRVVVRVGWGVAGADEISMTSEARVVRRASPVRVGLVRSSGHAAIDRTALALFSDVGSVRLPASLMGRSIELNFPVEFLGRQPGQVDQPSRCRSATQGGGITSPP